jgi:hypothetical protein
VYNILVKKIYLCNNLIIRGVVMSMIKVYVKSKIEIIKVCDWVDADIIVTADGIVKEVKSYLKGGGGALDNIEVEIPDTLSLLGISSEDLGYKHLENAIMTCMCRVNSLDDVTTLINEASGNVYYYMNQTVEKFLNQKDTDLKKKIFKFETIKKYSMVQQFVFCIVKYLREKCKECQYHIIGYSKTIGENKKIKIYLQGKNMELTSNEDKANIKIIITDHTTVKYLPEES